ncbi:hypothetical protein K443DRAFT_4029 [Laccaria amethystina LaAM-08-1]|uniref:DEAD/DEAH box helicase domain-containing protein n=1 Tax=Laccaria amethystina LaAM-08-1 TaxID=1095629 RepID=A0A0C9WZG0_9AGAR|nr:hypothetical protein K443DRAFT_4029 [Laccaria amethystina LaAM-08-1]
MLRILSLFMADLHGTSNNNDIVSISTTGSGKSPTFWILLFIPEAVQIVITPLDILRRQNVETLGKVGIQAIMIIAELSTAENFQVRITSAEIEVNGQLRDAVVK